MFFRTIFVWALGLPVTLMLFLCVLVSLIFDRSGNSVHSIGRIWSRYLLRLSGVRVRIDGLEKIPEGPAVFASNHQGAFDILVLQGCLPVQFRWVAKESLFKIPVVGWSMYLAGYIGINRSRAAMAYKSIERAAGKIKAEGNPVIIFPEGTRSASGEIMPFKRGGFLLALKSGVPIVPISISGTKDIMKKGRLSIRPGDVTLVIGDAIYPKDTGEKALMDAVHGAIKRGLEGRLP